MGNKSWKKIVLFMVFTLLVGLIGACSSGNKDATNKKGGKIKVKIAHVVSEDMTQHKMFVKLKELLESKSDGKFEVDIYPNGQLGGEREITESVQMGNVTITSPSVGLLSNFSSSLRVFEFPFIFDDKEIAYKVLDSEIGEELLKGLESSGLIGLGFSENGWNQLSTSTGPIVTPDDLKGIKLRTMEVPLHIDFWEELGANPTPMAFTEVFTGLSQGVIDGQENPYQLIYGMKFYEHNKFVTNTSHLFDTEPMIINKEFFESLSDADKKIVKDSTKEAIDYLRVINAEADEVYKEKLIADGVTITTLTPEQKELWIEKAKPIYKKYAEEIGIDTCIKVFEAADNKTALESIR